MLPVSAVLVVIATGGIGTSLGYGLLEFSLELLDAAIYATVDGDWYMAGLGIVFALVPGFTLLAKYLKNMGIPKFKKFLQKLGLWKAGKIGSESLSSQERRALNEFIEHSFNKDGTYKDNTYPINPNDNCKYCPFNNTSYCLK